ncbi:site-specific integrase [Phenylobacterium sp.]|uniref:tyrosine-type recombinase/integrase n=1 Tax=Phenylobacterium sp. TaxID=1871053 RepID=UPI0027378543|nr:site-specific integrase [Phenylobacterium sp.]MDP3869944.1 site-specific integrase [Phenylobacterium sp.]
MTIRPRGARYEVDVKVHASRNPTGLDVRVRTSATDRDTAIRLEALVRAEIMRTGSWVPGQGDAPTRGKRGGGTLADAIELAWDHPFEGWKLAKMGVTQRSSARMVVAILGPDRLCAEITEEDYQKVAETLVRDHNNSSDTVTKKIQAFHRTLYFAKKAGWIKARPDWKRATPGQPRQFTFTPEAEAQTIAYFRDVQGSQDMADLFCLGIDAGLRVGELLAAEAGDVDLASRFLKARGTEDVRKQRTTKNGETRTVILVDRAMDILRRRIKGLARNDLIFARWNHFKVSRMMLMARAEIDRPTNKEFTFHATRHTCATRMAEAGMELPDMMEQLGHKTASITLRYIKLAPAARRARILKSVGQGEPVAPI